MAWGRRTTERQRLEIYEQRWDIYSRDHGRCQSCGELVPYDCFEVAHRIADTKANRKRWGDTVVDHIMNKATTHSGKCNSAQNCGYNPVQSAALAHLITQVEEIKHG
jgi:hypothetical protein